MDKNKRKKKKRFQKKKQHDEHNKRKQQSSSSIMQQVEEQLKKQRLEKQGNNDKKKKRNAPRRVLGDYVYDPFQNSYFPKEATKQEHSSSGTLQHTTDEKLVRPLLGMHSHDPSIMREHHAPSHLLRLSESCTMSTQSNYQVRSWCAKRLMLETARVIPSCFYSNNHKWYSMLSPYWPAPKHGDLACKARVGSWSTTFDVSRGLQYETNLPAFVTLMDGGCLVRLLHPHTRPLWDLQQYQAFQMPSRTSTQPLLMSNSHVHYYSIPNLEAVKFQLRNHKLFQNENFLLGAIGDNPEQAKTTSMFYLFATNEPTCKTELSCRVNDFSLSITGTIDDYALAFAPRKCRQHPRVRPVFYSLMHQMIFSSAAQDFPQSDVLCVQHNLLDGMNSTLIYGHRNGTCCLLDGRHPTNCIFILGGDTKKKHTRDLGPITNLMSVPDNTNCTLLVRGMFGVIHVHDVRMMTSDNNTIGRTRRKSSLRNVLEPPKSFQHETLSSSHCTGMAMDPDGRVVISPYANSSTQGEPRLGMWCLENGKMVGSKRLTTRTTSNHQGGTAVLPYCELSNTVTDAFEIESSQEAPSGKVVSRSSRRFGLWLKCGAMEPHAPLQAGSIHHVTFAW